MKAASPIFVTEFGSVIEVRPEQPKKDELPILFTEFGSVIEVRPEQLKNAPFPILVTELPIMIEVRPKQLLKAKLAMPFIPSFTTIFVFVGIVPLYL